MAVKSGSARAVERRRPMGVGDGASGRRSGMKVRGVGA